MSILDKTKYIEYSKNETHLFGIKSGIVWGYDEHVCYPLLYISKPKNISEEDFRIILRKLTIHITK